MSAGWTALAGVLGLVGWAGLLRVLRLRSRGFLGIAPAVAAGFLQDLGFAGLAVGAAAGLAPVVAAPVAMGAVGVLLAGILGILWADHLLFLRIGVRFQPRGFAGAGDIGNVWTSMVELGGWQLPAGLCALAGVGAVGGLGSASLAELPAFQAGSLVALGGVLAVLGSVLPRHPATDNVVWLLAGDWTASRIRPFPVPPAGGPPVVPFEGETVEGTAPDAPQWRRTTGFQGRLRTGLRRSGRPDVLVVLLESQAAQHVGACGAAWGATPCFDAWSERGLFVPRAYGNGVQTVRGIAATMVGLPPRVSIQPMSAMGRPPRLRSLAHVLGEAGWHTAFWHNGDGDFHGQGPWLQRHLGVSEVGDKRDMLAADPGAAVFGSWGLHDEALYDHALRRLAEAREQPIFSLMLTLSHHHPWTTPPSWPQRPFEGASQALSAYLNAQAYADACLGRFLEGLQAAGRLEDTVLVLVGDHGAPTGVDGASFDSLFHLAEHGTRVPLLVLAPGRLDPVRVEDPASQVDVLPTILDLLGLEAEHHAVGTSLLREAGPRPIPLSNPFGGGWLGLVHGRHKLTWRPDRPRPTLHDVVADPLERTDLADAEPALTAELSERCLAVHRGVCALIEHDRAVPGGHP